MPRRPAVRLLARLLLATFLIASSLLAAGTWLLRGSMPQYEGRVASTALRAPVVAERDALGTPTIRANDRTDIAWALGYAHAQERYFEMDLLRRRAAGELAELFGEGALSADRDARVHRMRARMRQAYEGFDDAAREPIIAYAGGVNAGLAALSVRPFPYLLTGTTPTPWNEVDSLLVVAAMAFTLNDATNARELAFGRMHAALPESAWAFLSAQGGRWDAPIAGAALKWPEPPRADEIDLRTLDPSLLGSTQPDDGVRGSNAFAVAGALAGGPALVADDMHLDLRVPNLWFRARLVYPDPRDPRRTIDVTGASLPGAPAIVVGSNGEVAWGFTNAYADVTDWVRVTRDPADASRYRTPDGWQAFERHDELIRVKGGDDVELEIEDTRWGPLLATDADGTPLALAWSAREPGAINIELTRLELARSVDEAVTVAHASGIPPQNFIVGDRAGSIAWTIAGRLPRRVGDADPRLPGDWSQAGSGWNGWLDPVEIPLITNPPWQRLWSGNQRAVEGAGLARIGDGGYDLGARAMQIRDGLRARDAFTPADLLAVQLDDRALFLQHWKDLLEAELARMPVSAETTAIRTVLAQWEARASTGSASYRLVRSWRNEVVDRVLDGFAAKVRATYPDFSMPKLSQAEHAVWSLLQHRPAHLLPPGHADWNAFLADCTRRVGERLGIDDSGATPPTWGERNTARIVHPVSRALPAFVARWLDMPADELPGDSHMPRVQGPAFGASQRFAVAPGREAEGYFMMPGGQSGHPLSPYYGAGHADWVAGRPTPFLPGPVEQILRFEPVRQD
ncbi:MAG: penicillin acylase family protein [Lysobacteraceae bacterium]|nr:MAG: penicillin acylase family protein [Xanthomonadaceae bacterium]